LPDSILSMSRAGATGYPAFFHDRLRGVNTPLINNTSAQDSDAGNTSWFSVTAFNNLSYGLGIDGSYTGINNFTSSQYANWVLSRASGFFDQVCYTGNSTVGRAITHNLGVTPELIIVKNRSLATVWIAGTLFTSTNCNELTFSSNAQGLTLAYDNQFRAQPTASTFTVSGTNIINGSGNYIAYLFASCPGVSKVGSYTGNGSSQTINCGFTGGARFVMIKRTNSTGDWYVWDTARGIVAGNDPHLSLNTTAAEVTSNDTIDTDSTGFVVNQVAATNVNVNAATYIFLAIA
jgi:hypothetical protein